MDFFFVGERLAVDLLNTVFERRGRVEDALAVRGAVAAWAAAGGVLHGKDLRHRGLAQRRAARNLQTFRESLRRGLVAWAATGRPDPRLVALLNHHLAGDPEVVAVRVEGGSVVTNRRAAPTAAALDRLCGAVARSAAEMLAHDVPDRLRKCGSCRLMFYDVSKAGRRRWCSMQMCGARAKARAFRQRVRAPSKDNLPPPITTRTRAIPNASS